MEREKSAIYVAAYPKSGVTWLTRLLADVLDCPCGGSRPQDDEKEYATEGWLRRGDRVIRKGHFRLLNGDQGPVVPVAHRLAWRRMKDQKVVLLSRDPRDVILSGANYWRNSVSDQFDHVMRGTGPMAFHGAWNQYYSEWLDSEFTGFAYVRYEDLIESPVDIVFATLMQIGIVPEENRVKASVARQSFDATRERMRASKRERFSQAFHDRFMSTGRSHRWMDEISPIMSRNVKSMCGPTMHRLGY